jgi:hypothetical protein
VRVVVQVVVRSPAEMISPLKQNVAFLCQSERLRTGTSLSEAKKISPKQFSR